MANLLQKASIVLTPTAYDDGKVLCAKPSEPPYGDFDFSRNSAATRVNAQGLVENVQILSSNLVQNGDFSEEGVEEVSNGSFSQEGVQLITNGSFDTDSDWTKQTGWSISGGAANCDGTQSTANITQTVTNFTNKTFLVEGVASNVTQGFCYISLGGSDLQIVVNSNGAFKHYVNISTSNSTFYISARNNFIGSIDNVSVREVGQDWTLGTGWSIGEDKAVAENAYLTYLTSNQSLTIGKTYKITYTISDYVKGGIRYRGSSSTVGQTRTANGTYTDFLTSDTTLLRFQGTVDDGGFSGSITNISVKEVLQDWSVEDYGAVSASAVITPYTEGVKLEKTVSADWRSSFLVQPIPYTFGSQYKVTFRLKNGNLPSGGSVYVRREYDSSSQSIADGLVLTNDWVEYTYYFVANAGSTDISFGNVNWQNAGVGQYFYIDDVSVIEITDDTNLPRINYEGFSYQDALGSELVTNGDFEDGSANWVQASSSITISGGGANFDGTLSTSNVRQLNIVESAKQYKVTYTVRDYVQGLSAIRLGAYTTYQSGNGTFTEVITSTSIDLQIYGLSSFIGSIDNVSVKEYLGQEVVPDSGCGSWLFEPQSTNLITQSELFSDASWNASTDVIIDKGYLAPDGTNNATKVTADGAVPKVALFVSGVGPYTKSIYARTVSGTGTIYLGEGFPSGIAVLSNVTEQWQRFEVTNTLSNFYGADFRGASTLTEVIIWGAQFEDNISYATSYIPTEGSTVTRNQDVCTNGGSLASINSTEGTLYFEGAALVETDTTNRHLSISDGSNNNRLYFYYTTSGRFGFAAFVGGVLQVAITYDGVVLNNSKVACKYKENDYALWVDGVEVGTDTSASVWSSGTFDRINFSEPNGISSPFFGKTKAVAVWKEALSDQELADLTYPTPTDPTFSLNFDTIATDFTFARGSEATYVDAQGLIQSTNELGPEEITNGDFSTDGIPSTTSWSLGWYSQTSNVLISGGKLTLTNSASQSSALAYATDGVSSLNAVTVNKTYKLQYRVIENNGVTSFKYYSAGGSFIVAPTDLGVTHTIYIKNTANQIFLFQNATTNSSISIDNVSIKEYVTATNTPRLDYSTGAEAFLLEPQSTNLITQSELFSDAYWTKGGVSVASGFSSPSGDLNAYRLTEDTSSGQHKVDPSSISVVSGTEYTCSVFVKKDSRDILQMVWSGSFGSAYVNFDLTNETLQASGVAIGKIQSFSSDWYRCSITQVAAASGLGRCQILLQESISATRFGSYLGDGTSGLYIWGAQSEQQSYATSYIPTSGTTVTRNQETCINATPEINSEEGVLYAEISALADGGSYRIISLSDGTDSNRIIFFYDVSINRLSYQVRVGNASQFNGAINNVPVLQFNKVALKYKENDFALWINGVEVAAAAVGNIFPLNTLTKLSFSSGNGTSNFYGNTKDLKYYPKALSDAELIKLTT